MAQSKFPCNEDVEVLEALAAVATQTSETWNLELSDGDPISCSSVAKFEQFAGSLKPDQGKELVLFIKATVVNDFLVVGDLKIPERNLLDPILKLKKAKGITEVRIFFFVNETNAVSPDESSEIEPSHTGDDPSLMKGISLYRLNRLDGLPMQEIKRAAGIISLSSEKPQSALQFYQKLNSKDSELRMAMVPSGNLERAAHEDSSRSSGREDAAVILTVKYESDKGMNVSKDKQCIKEFCKRIKCLSSPLEVSGRILSELKQRLKTVVTELTKREEAGTLRNIWIFVNAHGNSLGIGLDDDDEIYISLEELTRQFFDGSLAGKTKNLITNVCRGNWPRPQQEEQADSNNESKFGLMFRNRAGNDPWSVRGLQNCYTMFGSLPGFLAFYPDEEPSLLFEAMRKAAEELRGPEGFHAFVQRVQRCMDMRRNQEKKSAAAEQGLTGSEVQDVQGNAASVEQTEGSQIRVTTSAQSPMDVEPSPADTGRPDSGQVADMLGDRDRKSGGQGEKTPQTHCVVQRAGGSDAPVLEPKH